ncbi:hypothetical protein JAAARDRAFT_188683 [Jaapia argillacea MUCL 33604]|uniref:DUF292-domain-containing protein n=1 Tax=Jaapia argillacea MUCL 33604 TaxID=933084 RepID=A0A067QHS5_9AGAM|nr:hypothetical protein JAAARDRAFT_188683 [Jaapia argillacea MUCL 33604]
MPPLWNAAKAKVQLRLSVQRLRTLQEKKEAQAKSTRRDIATLLERGKIETARIKVENIINEDIYLELLELMELYCELLIARFGILDQPTREPDAAVREGVCSIIHAAPRTELKELQILRELLMHKYGREFSLAAIENRDSCVTERVTKKLVVATPSPELVNAYLSEIAKGYSIAWSPPQNNIDESSGGGVKEAVGEAGVSTTQPLPADSSVSHSGVDSEKGGNAFEKELKLPGLPPTEDSAGTSADNVAAKPKPPEDDFAVLAKRFEVLKKR